MKARVQEMVAAALLKMNYSSPLDFSSGPSPMPSRCAPYPVALVSVALADAVAAHKAKGERLRLAMLDHERRQREVAERAETDRPVSLYRTMQEEPSRKMQELEAAEDSVAEAFARQRDVAAAQRVAVSRQLEPMQQVIAAGVPPLGSFFAAQDLTLLPSHM